MATSSTVHLRSERGNLVGMDASAETVIAGVDEAGRGCLAGPVFAAAVILPPHHGLQGLNDSKQLSARQRERLFDAIKQRAIAWSIGRAEALEIDQVNILQATFLAMRRSVETLSIQPTLCRIDGNQRPPMALPTEMVIGGDAIHAEIMAASILAKVARDAELIQLDFEYPGYGFAQHKGYGTAQHLTALRELGPCGHHRMSFAPCAQSARAFGLTA